MGEVAQMRWSRIARLVYAATLAVWKPQPPYAEARRRRALRSEPDVLGRSRFVNSRGGGAVRLRPVSTWFSACLLRMRASIASSIGRFRLPLSHGHFHLLSVLFSAASRLSPRINLLGQLGQRRIGFFFLGQCLLEKGGCLFLA